MWSRLSTLWRALRGRPEFEDTLADEIRDHIDRYVADLIATGASPAAARRQARIEFGNIDNVRADCREARRVRWIDDAAQDVGYATRLLARSPGFAVVTVLTLAVAFGANQVIFRALETIVSGPLPYRDAGRAFALAADKSQSMKVLLSFE